MSKMEKHLKQKHFKDHDSFLKKKDEKKTKRVERLQKKLKRKDKKEEMNSEEGKRKRGEAKIKKIMKDDAKATINRFTGTGEMLWKHFHQMPNSEFLKCKHCHRFVIVIFNSLKRGVYLTSMIYINTLHYNYHNKKFVAIKTNLNFCVVIGAELNKRGHF